MLRFSNLTTAVLDGAWLCMLMDFQLRSLETRPHQSSQTAVNGASRQSKASQPANKFIHEELQESIRGFRVESESRRAIVIILMNTKEAGKEQSRTLRTWFITQEDIHSTIKPTASIFNNRLMETYWKWVFISSGCVWQFWSNFLHLHSKSF